MWKHTELPQRLRNYGRLILAIVLSVTQEEVRGKVLVPDAGFRRLQVGLLEIVPNVPPYCNLFMRFVFPLNDSMRKDETCSAHRHAT